MGYFGSMAERKQYGRGERIDYYKRYMYFKELTEDEREQDDWAFDERDQGGTHMSLLFTSLAVCSIAGVLKGSTFCFAATFAFAALAIACECTEKTARRIQI